MRVEELIELLRTIPPTAQVEIACGQLPADFCNDDFIEADPSDVVYELGVTIIKCEVR